MSSPPSLTPTPAPRQPSRRQSRPPLDRHAARPISDRDLDREPCSALIRGKMPASYDGESFPRFANLVQLGVVVGPAAVRIVSEFRFGVNSGAAPTSMLRLRRRLLIALLAPASKRSSAVGLTGRAGARSSRRISSRLDGRIAEGRRGGRRSSARPPKRRPAGRLADHPFRTTGVAKMPHSPPASLQARLAAP